jgi:hypothetical protein
VVYLRPKTRAFIPLSLTSSKLYIIYNNLLSYLIRVEDFIYYITNKGQLIYNNNPKLYKFLSKLKYLYPKQVLVIFKVSRLIDLYIKELKNNI